MYSAANEARTGNAFPRRKVSLPEPGARRHVPGIFGGEVVEVEFSVAHRPQTARCCQLERELLASADGIRHAKPSWIIDPERRRKAECTQETRDDQQAEPDHVQRRHVVTHLVFAATTS